MSANLRITIRVSSISIDCTEDEKGEIRIIAGHGTNDNNDRLANNDVWSEDGSRIKNQVGTGVENPNTLRTEAGNVNITDISGIKLVLPYHLAQMVFSYIKWKEKIKNKKATNDFTITFQKINYQDVIATAGESLPNVFSVLDHYLVLDENSFLPTDGGKIDSWSKVREVVEINNFDNTQADYDRTNKKDFDGTPGQVNDPSEKQIFADLVEKFFQNFDLSIPSIGELDNMIEGFSEFIPADTDTDTDYEYDYLNATNISESRAKKSLFWYQLSETSSNSRDKNLIREEILSQRKLFQELKVWRRIGFDSIEDVLRANANGYWISQRNNGTILDEHNAISDGTNYGQLNEETREGKVNIEAILKPATNNMSIGLGRAKYKGFPIIDRKEQLRFRQMSNDGNNSITAFENGLPTQFMFNSSNRWKRCTIDNLRKLEVKDGADEVSELSVFKDISRVTEKDLFGFQPYDDINSDGKYRRIDLKNSNVWKVAKAGKSTKDHRMTRIKFKIQSSTNKDDIVLILFGELKTDDDYFEVRHSLNESITHQETLDDYYDFIKNNEVVTMGQGPNYNDNNENNQEVMNQFDWVYTHLSKWTTIWDKDYSQKSELECQNDKNILKEFLASEIMSLKNLPETEKETEKMVKFLTRMAWPKDLLDKFSQVNERLEIFLENRIISQQITDFLATETTKDWSETAKKVFSENSNQLTLEKFVALKNLVSCLEAVRGDSADNLTDLEKFSQAEESKPEEKALAESWKLANRTGIENGKGWGTRELEKMTDKVVAARAEVKTFMDELDKDNAYNAIGVADLKKISEINDIKNLFNLAKKGYAMTSRNSTDYETVLQFLQEAENANNEAWKKVNQYKKDGQGYAVRSKKKLVEFKVKAAVTNNETPWYKGFYFIGIVAVTGIVLILGTVLYFKRKKRVVRGKDC